MKTLSPNTLVGRLGSGLPGPAQAIPFVDVGAQIGFVNVKSFGAKGDGSTDDTAAIQAAINYCFPTASSSDSFTAALNNQGILLFPPGNYIVSSPLNFVGINGAHILGSGRLTTQITQTQTDDVFYCNGIAYSIIEGICFTSPSGGGTTGNACVELDWDGTTSPNTHSITVRDCFFNTGDFGVYLGGSGFQVSEIGFYNNYFANNLIAGIQTANQNVLNIGVYGGDFEGCSAYAIRMHLGFIEVISGVAFENGSNTYDIFVENSAGDGCVISGCRSESTNFLNAQRGLNTVQSCNHAGTGIFAWAGFHGLSLINCNTNGTIKGGSGSGSGTFDIAGCEFNPSAFAASGTLGRIRNSYYGGGVDAGYSTYVYDAWFKGTTFLANGGQNIPNIQSYYMNTAAPSGFGAGFGVQLTTDTDARLSLGLDGSNNPLIQFGAGGSSAVDTGISRIAPVSSIPTIAIGNATNGDASGTIQAKTKAGAPTASDVPAGTWVLIRDTTNSTTKLYYNNAGTLQSVALS